MMLVCMSTDKVLIVEGCMGIVACAWFGDELVHPYFLDWIQLGFYLSI
jgi:hypothetical protein